MGSKTALQRVAKTLAESHKKKKEENAELEKRIKALAAVAAGAKKLLSRKEEADLKDSVKDLEAERKKLLERAEKAEKALASGICDLGAYAVKVVHPLREHMNDLERTNFAALLKCRDQRTEIARLEGKLAAKDVELAAKDAALAVKDAAFAAKDAQQKKHFQSMLE